MKLSPLLELPKREMEEAQWKSRKETNAEPVAGGRVARNWSMVGHLLALGSTESIGDFFLASRGRCWDFLRLP